VKVLWLTPVQLPAVEKRVAPTVFRGGGWLESLRAALCAEGSLQLGMAAAGETPFEPFDEGGVQYFHVQAPPRPRSGLAGVVAGWRHRADEASLLAGATSVIEQFQPDLIHVHGSEGPFGVLVTTTTKPVIISLQGILLVYSRAFFSGVPVVDVMRSAVSLECAKGRGLLHDYAYMRVAAQRELNVLRACHYFAGRTDWDRGIVSVVNPHAHYYHVEEVLRPEFYLPDWRQSSGGTFVVYTTLGPAPYKGLINLLEAVALLRESALPDMRLRVAGRIQGSAMWPITQRALDRWRLHGAVDWLGSLAPAEIALELGGASVYVHPSIVENSPNSLAEAMILGVPCVAASAGGVPSLLKDGHEGLLCSPNDVYGLAAAIGAVAADPVRAARLGTNARVRARRRHDPRTIAQAMIATYETVVSDHDARSP